MEKLMKPLLFVFALLLVFNQVAVSAQTTPKDGDKQAATDLDRVKVGQAAPDFTLEDSEGKNIGLADYRGKKNVVLVFYRGHW
jgi:cytochrome oxidase Cu insertion factor (SCO1/SenC/PrrC family)